MNKNNNLFLEKINLENRYKEMEESLNKLNFFKKEFEEYNNEKQKLFYTLDYQILPLNTKNLIEDINIYIQID